MIIRSATRLTAGAAIVAAVGSFGLAPDHAAAASQATQVHQAGAAARSTQVTMHANRHTVRLWHTVVLTGTGPAGHGVFVQQKIGAGHWHRFPATSTVRRDAHYTVRVQSGRTGHNYFRVRIAGQYSAATPVLVLRTDATTLGRSRGAGLDQGYGSVRPSVIDNGGDVAGLAVQVHWRHWGSGTTTATGLTSINKPKGGYYKKQGRVEFRAERVRYCSATKSMAYTRLTAREVVAPGSSHFTHWFDWSPRAHIC